MISIFAVSRPNEAPSVVCAVALPTRAAAAVHFALNLVPSQYGLVVPPGSKVAVTDLATGAQLGSYTDNVTYATTITSFGVLVIKLSVVR